MFVHVCKEQKNTQFLKSNNESFTSPLNSSRLEGKGVWLNQKPRNVVKSVVGETESVKFAFQCHSGCSLSVMGGDNEQ